MAKSKFNYEKRNREIEKQRKKALKRQKRFARKSDGDGDGQIADPPAPDGDPAGLIDRQDPIPPPAAPAQGVL